MIKRLAHDVSVRIAAGEVIERPASVAKELMENSIDAGARSIAIQTESGGKSSFVIEDDGCGISFAELPLAIERYATSKIREIDDLEHIATLGYRGEALASVAAVSRMEIRSRSEGEEGGILRCEGGAVTLHTQTNARAGTRIQIDDLFYNLPARRKFLKTSSAELRRIIQIINDYALIHPDIAFRLSENGKKIVEYLPVEGIAEALERRWGRQTRIYAAEASAGALHASLWWNPMPDSRRIAAMIFVNGRRVQDGAVRAALSAGEGAAYGEWMVKIDLPPADVDVNIHPTKEEVRFRRGQELFKAVYDAAKAACSQRHAISAQPAQATAPFGMGDAAPFTAQMQPASECPSTAWTLTSKSRYTPPSRTASPVQNIFTPAPQTPETEAQRQSSLLPEELPPRRYIGQNAQGFLIFDFPEALAIMDPHAAHERILFEEICASFKENIAVQWLTLPMEIPQAVAAEAALREDELSRLGFVIKEGRVAAVPAIRGKGHLSPTDMLRSALRGLETENDPQKRDREVWWRMARLACRDAVKLGRSFEPEEAEELLRRLELCDTPFTCPHGRPTVFLIENNKLREWFER